MIASTTKSKHQSSTITLPIVVGSFRSFPITASRNAVIVVKVIPTTKTPVNHAAPPHPPALVTTPATGDRTIPISNTTTDALLKIGFFISTLPCGEP